jgi:type IV pilus assembly protein PilA
MALGEHSQRLAQILQSTGLQASAAVSSSHHQESLFMKKIQQGFTLIELMIVVAIIGILAAIAIPAYQDYTIRAQVTEGLNLAGAVKAGVAEAFANNGEWPADLDAAGGDTAVPPSGKYVESVIVTNGTISITYGEDANTQLTDSGALLTLTPKISDNNDVIWLCGYYTGAGITAGLNDPVAGAAAVIATDVESKYLPSSCRLD